MPQPVSLPAAAFGNWLAYLARAGCGFTGLAAAAAAYGEHVDAEAAAVEAAYVAELRAISAADRERIYHCTAQAAEAETAELAVILREHAEAWRRHNLDALAEADEASERLAGLLRRPTPQADPATQDAQR